MRFVESMVTNVPFFMRIEDIGHKRHKSHKKHKAKRKVHKENARRA